MCADRVRVLFFTMQLALFSLRNDELSVMCFDVCSGWWPAPVVRLLYRTYTHTHTQNSLHCAPARPCDVTGTALPVCEFARIIGSCAYKSGSRSK